MHKIFKHHMRGAGKNMITILQTITISKTDILMQHFNWRFNSILYHVVFYHTAYMLAICIVIKLHIYIKHYYRVERNVVFSYFPHVHFEHKMHLSQLPFRSPYTLCLRNKNLNLDCYMLRRYNTTPLWFSWLKTFILEILLHNIRANVCWCIMQVRIIHLIILSQWSFWC